MTITTDFSRVFGAVLLVVMFISSSVLAGGGHAHRGEADHADHGDEENLVYTHYSDTTELFVEFPPLVAGKSATFAAHVTRLSDFRPLTRGIMDVYLQKNGKTVARFRVREPARKGIFTPAITPKTPGQYSLMIEVQDEELRAKHNLGKVTVYAKEEGVLVDQETPEGEISYLKEQQWVNPFVTTQVRARELRLSVPGFATVQAPADGSALVRAPSDGYFLAASLINAGQVVETDQLLGTLVPRLGEGADIGNLLVAVERARSQLQLATQDTERLQELFDQGAVPERRLIEAREALEVAKIEMQTTQSRLQQRSGSAEHAGINLYAPIKGEVVAVNVRPGAFVRADDPLFILAVPDRRWLEVDVPEHYANPIRAATGAWLPGFTNQDVTVVLDAANNARVVNINSVIDPVTRTTAVSVEYPISVGPTLIGARYAAHVFYGEPQTKPAIPRSAVIDDDGQAVVYVQNGGETFARRGVILGIVDGDWVEVISGVVENERVVSEGAYYVKLAASGGSEIGHGHAH